MSTMGPARAYYEACRGRWRSTLSITISDPAALDRSGMSLLDRVGLRLAARWPWWLGRITLDTSVDLPGDTEVVHTTVVRWLGIPLRRSVEVFTLDPDGGRFSVRGGMTGHGSVDPTATRAEYTLTWLGAEVRQRTLREGDRVTVHQEGPGFQGHQVLTRSHA